MYTFNDFFGAAVDEPLFFDRQVSAVLHLKYLYQMQTILRLASFLRECQFQYSLYHITRNCSKPGFHIRSVG